MLRSYSRAIQSQQNSTGSLFQAKTKAICLTQTEGVSPTWFQSEYGTTEKGLKSLAWNLMLHAATDRMTSSHPISKKRSESRNLDTGNPRYSLYLFLSSPLIIINESNLYT
jgi:hypothetical protein